MSSQTIIYPMAYVPNNHVTGKLYYVGFPAAWKESLIRVERIIKPRWDGTYALPTYALNNSLGAWMDGIIELSPLRKESHDEMWAISCNQEINTDMLFEHIVIWLHSYYLANPKVTPNAKLEIKALLDTMKVDDLKGLKGSKEVRLFDDKGIPTENYSYSAFTLMITNALVGKRVDIDGHSVTLNYAGKNHLISDIQREGDRVYSYGISFSLQTIPPERKALLLCDCSIHRWIPGKQNDIQNPYLNHENLIAHVWVGNHRIYKLPVQQMYKSEEGYVWQGVEQKYYNLYNYKALPTARELVDNIDAYLHAEVPITCLYKNGMVNNGFIKNVTGTGVSVREKKDLYDSIMTYISEMVFPVEGVDRVKAGKNAKMKLKLDEIHFNKELDEEQRIFVAKRIRECIESNRLNLEVYYGDNAEDCADLILEKLQNIFQSTDAMSFTFKKCKLGRMGEALENSNSAAIMKRIREIHKDIKKPSVTTACIVLLPGKENYKDNDPKNAIRCGFALKNRLTQFITPWTNEDISKEGQQKAIDNKVASAIEDLCRQLGYLRVYDEKVIKNENLLAHTPTIGMHVMTQLKTMHGKARFLPLFVEIDYITGQAFVECDAFEHVRVPYREAAFELAKLSLDKDFEKKCDIASKGMLKQKMIMWKNLYKNENVLVMIEANGNTRALCHGITDGQIQKYTYRAPYCPEKIEVGTKENSYMLSLNDSKVRFVRIRRNGEVPDYFTEMSKPEVHTASSGIFKYEKDYWSVAGRPNDKSYTLSYKETTYSKPRQKFAERDMIEIYPIQLQEGDNPDEWVLYTNSLRLGAIQYDEATVMPLPIHLAAKLEEYVLVVK